MSQKKSRQQKKPKSEIKLAEERFQSCVVKRNNFNDEARALRDERNALHDQRGKIMEEIKKIEWVHNNILMVHLVWLSSSRNCKPRHRQLQCTYFLSLAKCARNSSGPKNPVSLLSGISLPSACKNKIVGNPTKLYRSAS